MITIRAATPSDAAAFLALKSALDRESSLMMLEPGERTTTVQQERAGLEALTSRDNSTILLAEEGEDLLGYVQADGGEYRRNRHSAHVVIGVRAAAAGQGVGTRLLEALDAWACGRVLGRLELTVQAHNHAAIALYNKMGYVTEGTRRRSLLVDGVWVDELAMAKVIDAGAGQPDAE